MSSVSELVQNAVEAARKAVQFDQNNQYSPAIYFYETAAKLLNQAAAVSSPEKSVSLTQKSSEYKYRAEELRETKTAKNTIIQNEDEEKLKVKRGYFLLQQAIDEDESGDTEDAIELYTKAIEYITQNPSLLQGDLKDLALRALERAEKLKGTNKNRIINFFD